MRSERNIERSFKQANLDVAIGAKRDRRVLDELAEVQRKSPSHTTGWPVPCSWVMALVAVVAAVTVVALLVGRSRRPEPKPAPPGKRTASTIELATAISLEKAFRQGGIEAVEKQYREAFGTPQTRDETLSIEALLTHVETETEDLWR